MRVIDIYNNAVRIGMRNDPRPKKDVQNVLIRNKKTLRSLKAKERTLFDMESLYNPYNDTRILYGDKNRDIKTVMVGIDIEGAELLVADRLNQIGQTVDLVMAHHPAGRALAELYKVMDLQTDQLKRLGISAEVAEDVMKERIAEVARGFHTRNCMRTIDIARLLDIPFMCVHTAADNMVTIFLQRLMDRSRPKTVGALLDILEDVYEYREGAKVGLGPKILLGERKSPCGRIFVDMTGGTEGSKRIFGRLSQIGIGTLISMHLSEEHYKQAKREHINIIIAGHIPSDSIGLNLILDELISKEKAGFNILPCSGFIRHSR